MFLKPGEFVIFMLSITIEKEHFEVNCLYKTRWDSYPGIVRENKSFLLKKTCPTFYTPFLFIKYSKQKHIQTDPSS
jgi:hypothetical protein